MKENAAARPLLQDDELTAPMESNTSLLSSIGGVGVGVGGAGAGGGEQDDGENENKRQRRHIPTIAFIIVPMIIFIIGVFLAAAFMPQTEHETTPSPGPSPQHNNSKLGIIGKFHDDPVAPTLLSIRDHRSGDLMNVHTNYLYTQMKTATFRQTELLSLHTDKNKVGYGDALTLSFGVRLEDMMSDEDIVALYCPAGEADPRRFRDVATLAQVRATHDANHHHHDKSSERRTKKNVWSIPSFPIVREESCEFRMYTHSSVDGTGHKDQDGHHYTLVAATEPISLTSNRNPTGIHISLTGKSSEMNIQFVTGDSGEPVVEITKKSDIHSQKESRKLLQVLEATEISWTKHKGESTSYAATDMCQGPATSTEPGFFISPGHLHTVKVTNLEPNTDYVYRPGIGYGQGIKFSDKYYEFRSSPPPGTGSPSPEKPAVTFLALADQGCPDSTIGQPGPMAGDQVTELITSLIDGQTIDSIHQIGDHSYARGAAHVWDVWMNMIQAYASRVPVMVGVGNQEYDHTEGGGGGKDISGVLTEFGFQPSWGQGAFQSTGGECGVPIAKRFAAPDNGNGVFWYSYDQSLVHTVVLSSEHNATIGSTQYIWLEQDLAAVNRSITPWLVVELHRPIYNSEVFDTNPWMGPMVQEGIQNEVEDLLYTYQVDLVLSGHYHSYFRSCDGLYAYKCYQHGGPTYITVGTGGAPLDKYLNSSLSPNHYTAFFDETNFGVGRASAFNATTMHWEFVAVGGNVTDEVWIQRDR